MTYNRRQFIKLGSMVSLCSVLPQSIFSENSTGEFSFIQLTDTHVPTPAGALNTNIIVNMINKLKLPYEMIIHTGDVIHHRGSEKEMQQAGEYFKFRQPVYFVPGNHDVTFDRSKEYLPLFEHYFNPTNFTIQPNPSIRLAFFNSCMISDKAPKKDRRRAFEVLAEMLKIKRPTILFCHATGLPDFYGNKMHKGWKEKTMRKWTEIMKTGGVIAVLAGHFHRDEYHIRDNIPFHICAPVASFWGRQASFRYWTFSSAGLTYRTMYA